MCFVNSALIRKLRREAAANPAKAAVLGIVVLIAFWFWIPLAIHWCSPSSATDDTANSTAATPGEAPQTPAAKTVEQEPATNPSPTQSSIAVKASSDWRSIVRTASKDQRTRPNRKIGQMRDPFGPSAREIAETQARTERKKRVAKVPDLKPADAGLVLNSTLVGSGRPIALIDGEPYGEGDAVRATRGDATFTVVEILPRRIVLSRQGKQYNLEIQSNPRVSDETRADIRASISDANLQTSPIRNHRMRGEKAGALSGRSNSALGSPNTQ